MYVLYHVLGEENISYKYFIYDNKFENISMKVGCVCGYYIYRMEYKKGIEINLLLNKTDWLEGIDSTKWCWPVIGLSHLTKPDDDGGMNKSKLIAIIQELNSFTNQTTL